MHLLSDKPARTSGDEGGSGNSISMMIRTACFVLTVILPSPYRWFALAGAVTLPYFAVVIANAGRETVSRGSDIVEDKPLALD